jgi:uncharacterized membrane protein YhhN
LRERKDLPMPDDGNSSFSISRGTGALSGDGAWASVLILIFLGIFGHWVYDALVAALQTGTFDMGTPVVWALRAGVAIIAAVLAFSGIYEQVRRMTNPIRLFTAFTLGFAIDALSGPLISAGANSGPAPEPASFVRLFLLG